MKNYYSTGIPDLDRLIVGTGNLESCGYPRGMVTEVSGPELYVNFLLSQAKSTVVLTPVDLMEALKSSKTRVVVWQSPAAEGYAQQVTALLPVVLDWLTQSKKALVITQCADDSDCKAIKYHARLRLRVSADHVKIIKNMLFASQGHELRDWV